MAAVLGLLSMVVGLGSLVCLIIVLTKLFPEEGVGKGILGIICGLYTFIWGWLNADRLNIKTLMLIWTVLLVAALILNFATPMLSRPGVG